LAANLGVGAAWQLNQLRFGDQSGIHGRSQPAYYHPAANGRHRSFSHPITHGRTNRHTAANGHTNPYRHSHGDSNRYGNRYGNRHADRHADHHTHTLNYPHTDSHGRARLAHRSTAYPLRPASGRGG